MATVFFSFSDNSNMKLRLKLAQLKKFTVQYFLDLVESIFFSGGFLYNSY